MKKAIEIADSRLVIQTSEISILVLWWKLYIVKQQSAAGTMSLNVVSSEALSAEADNQFYDDIFCALKGRCYQ